MGTNNAPGWQHWLDEISELNPEAVSYDGFEPCIVGIVERFGQPVLLAYDYEACIQLLIGRDGMDRDEAIEFFEFNTLGLWAGDHTPVFIHLTT